MFEKSNLNASTNSNTANKNYYKKWDRRHTLMKEAKMLNCGLEFTMPKMSVHPLEFKTTGT